MSEKQAQYFGTPSDPPTAGTWAPRARDRQVGGDHYRGRAMQPWDIIDAWGLDFYEGNALKYLLRRKQGTPREDDLRKAIHYLERALERLGEPCGEPDDGRWRMG